MITSRFPWAVLFWHVSVGKHKDQTPIVNFVGAKQMQSLQDNQRCYLEGPGVLPIVRNQKTKNNNNKINNNK